MGDTIRLHWEQLGGYAFTNSVVVLPIIIVFVLEAGSSILQIAI